jgi:hypothetical protein
MLPMRVARGEGKRRVPSRARGYLLSPKPARAPSGRLFRWAKGTPVRVWAKSPAGYGRANSQPDWTGLDCCHPPKAGDIMKSLGGIVLPKRLALAVLLAAGELVRQRIAPRAPVASAARGAANESYALAGDFGR